MNKDETPLQSIFVEALEIEEPRRRAAFLSRVCGTDTPIRREVEELLQAEVAARNFLPGKPATCAARAALLEVTETLDPGRGPSARCSEKSGDRIGRYRLIKKIGEGGCGVVYLAEQEEPVRRRVALKVIKLGMDTRNVIIRFEAERQTLALMDHPNIARVFDAGATETGRPFFVMELVDGIRVTHYCDQAKLSIRERLELFIKVCHAIQHAHQKGIIHRDLKPSNILVATNDGGAVPKVIDFGIAKAQVGLQPEDTLLTGFQQLLGTPAYMSPEQATLTNTDIDTRSDIYSLGVLLYELLTGKTPFDTKALLASGVDVLRRTIRETEPARPSTRLSALLDGDLPKTASHRQTEPAKLIQVLRGDLDWIVMKCLEKDRTRRYETANALAMDLQRYLHNEPVLARPPSRLYEFQTTVRRHKLGFAAAAAVILTLATGVTVSTWQAIRAEHQSQQRHRNVVRQYVANGTRLMNEGDLFAALLWYTEALRLDAGDARREEPHRIRIASVLRQCPKLANVFAHGTMLYHAEFSPDGKRVVTASDDHTARVWNVASGQQLLILQHDGEVYDATFSLDGRRIVTSSPDKTARVWDSQTGALVCTLGHKETIWRSCFSPDGRLVATACQDKTARLWNAQSGERIGEPLLHESFVQRVTFSPDGQFLATATGMASASVWDVATGERRFQGPHSGYFADVSFSPDSQWFLTSDGPNLRMRDTQTLKESSFFPIRLNGGMNAISLSLDGRMIVAGGNNCTAQVWDASTGQPLFSPPVRHAGGILDVHISPDGRRFVTGGRDTVAQVWSTRTGLPLAPPLKLILHAKFVQFNPDGRQVLINSCDQAARVWDLATSDLPIPARPKLPNERQFISPNGQYLLQQGESNAVWIADAYSGHGLAALPHTNKVTYASFSRDGRSVITASEELNEVSSMRNDLFLWNAPTGQQLNTNPMAHKFRLLYAAFSPDSRRLLTCGFDYTARLWDVRTGQPLSAWLPHRQSITWGAFSPDGRSVVTVSQDKTARVWDAATGDPLTAPLHHKAAVTGAFWSTDGMRLHTLTEDDHLQVWDLANGEPLTPPQKIQAPPADSFPSDTLTANQLTEDLPRDGRPVADLVRLAQMLAVGRIDNRGNVVPLRREELTSAWETLQKTYADQFGATTTETVAWHLREARQSEAEGNVAAALFHLDRAIERQPRDEVLTRRRAEVAAALALGNGVPIVRHSGPSPIPPRDPQASPDQIDLSPHYNLGLKDSKAAGEDFAELPSGLQIFGGVRFDVRGLVNLSGTQGKLEGSVFPERVSAIRIGRKCRQLHFLHAAEWAEEVGQGTQIGSYVLHYADGQKVDLPILAGRDVGDWYFASAPIGPSEPGGAIAVWTGNNRAGAIYGLTLCLYKSTRANPRPEVKLMSMDFVSSLSLASPFLVALTVE